MLGIIGGPGLLFRFAIAGMTAILVVSVMSLAVGVVVGTGDGGAVTGGLTGRFLQNAPGTAQVYIIAEIIVGVLTFLGSLFVLSKK